METKLVSVAKREDFGSKAYLEKTVVGHWYKFIHTGISNNCGYGKVVAINDDGTVEVVKYFELPDYRPYASRNWFDSLPYAI